MGSVMTVTATVQSVMQSMRPVNVHTKMMLVVATVMMPAMLVTIGGKAGAGRGDDRQAGQSCNGFHQPCPSMMMVLVVSF